MPEEKNSLTYEEQLDSFAVINEKAKIMEDKEHYVHIKVELDYSDSFQTMVKLLKPRTHKTYQLYGLGLEVYRKIIRDQVRIRNLVNWLRNKYKLSFYEARNLIIQFTGDLIRNGIIVIETE